MSHFNKYPTHLLAEIDQIIETNETLMNRTILYLDCVEQEVKLLDSFTKDLAENSKRLSKMLTELRAKNVGPN